ncbi:hypothetical protein QZH41_015661, partial [Actinostola sp. cb2023]
MADEGEKSEMIAEFSGVTGSNAERAQFFLESSGWQLHLALSSFYEDGADDSPSPPPQSTPPHQQTNQSQGTSARIATMAAYRASGDDNSDSDEEQGQAFYAGGSVTSGQQILGPPKSRKKGTPHDIAQDIFEEAKRHGAEEIHDDETGPGPSSRTAPFFTGAGYRLGDTEGGQSQPTVGASRLVAATEQDTEVILKFWSNGFTVDDGELQSFDDPSNKEFLDSVKKGEIPRHLHRLSQGGEVHVNLEDHRHEEYTPPKKKKAIAFVGQGQKLGSPTPTVKFNEENKVVSADSVPAIVSYDQSKPTTSIQLRLADGTRLVSKFNPSQTVGDIRAFIT